MINFNNNNRDFHIGDKVVCIVDLNDIPNVKQHYSSIPEKGKVYCVRGVYEITKAEMTAIYLFLVGIKGRVYNSPPNDKENPYKMLEMAFSAKAFMKLDDYKNQNRREFGGSEQNFCGE